MRIADIINKPRSNTIKGHPLTNTRPAPIHNNGIDAPRLNKNRVNSINGDKIHVIKIIRPVPDIHCIHRQRITQRGIKIRLSTCKKKSRQVNRRNVSNPLGISALGISRVPVNDVNVIGKSQLLSRARSVAFETHLVKISLLNEIDKIRMKL